MNTKMISINKGCVLTLKYTTTNITRRQFSSNTTYEFVDLSRTDIEKICKEAFDDSRITSIRLCGSLKTIGPKAFSGSKISSITIPAGVTFVGTRALEYTPLKTIFLDAYNPQSVRVTWGSYALGMPNHCEANGLSIMVTNQQCIDFFKANPNHPLHCYVPFMKVNILAQRGNQFESMTVKKKLALAEDANSEIYNYQDYIRYKDSTNGFCSESPYVKTGDPIFIESYQGAGGAFTDGEFILHYTTKKQYGECLYSDSIGGKDYFVYPVKVRRIQASNPSVKYFARLSCIGNPSDDVSLKTQTEEKAKAYGRLPQEYLKIFMRPSDDGLKAIEAFSKRVAATALL